MRTDLENLMTERDELRAARSMQAMIWRERFADLDALQETLVSESRDCIARSRRLLHDTQSGYRQCSDDLSGAESLAADPQEGDDGFTAAGVATAADERFMALALEQAVAAIGRGQTPFGAVVVDADGRLIGQGHNCVRSDRDPSAHGSIVAIRDAWRQVGAGQGLAGCTLYASCEPCLQCSSVIGRTGLARVVYAARGADVPGYRPLLGAGFAEAAAWINADPGRRLEALGDVLRERARAIIDSVPWDEAAARSPADPAEQP